MAGKKTKYGYSPTFLTMREMRRLGYPVVEKVEHRAVIGPGGQSILRDLFGFVDVVAVGAGAMALIQTTTKGNITSRIRKVTNTPELHEKAVELLKVPGVYITFHGWYKRRVWLCDERNLIIDISSGNLTVISLGQVSDSHP